MPQSIDTMTVRDAVFGRSSVPAFAPKQIDQSTLRTLSAAASALNRADVMHDLGVPPETTVGAPIIVGKPRGEALSSPRKKPHVVAWRQLAPFMPP